MSNSAAHEFIRLVEIMATLRSPEGCPWDREQTIDSLKPFVLEEAYEVVHAIDRHDHAALCGELGDFVASARHFDALRLIAAHRGGRTCQALQPIGQMARAQRPEERGGGAEGDGNPQNANP